MFRSRSHRLVCVTFLWMGLMLVLPLTTSAEAATHKKTTTRQRVSARHRASASSTVARTSSHVARTTATTRVVKAKNYSATRATARRTRYYAAKAAAYARDARALQAPLYKVDASGEQVPDIRAEAAIIYNPVTHQVIWEENSNATRSIASITKVMTAVVFFEHATDFSSEYEVDPIDTRNASTTYLKAHEKITPNALLHLMLIGSDNAAARMLARISPMGSAGFIDQMNAKAKELNLETTHYADPCGLDANNVSSAFDMAQLISFAANDERISSIMRMSEDTVFTSRRTVTVHSTNKLLAGGEIPVRGGKTGFIRQAGYCLATLLQMPQGDPMAVVVLGARSNAGRFMETRHLFEWISDRTKVLLKPEAPKATDINLPPVPPPVQQPQVQQ
jgi:serine-type D-Ala-D-Ala endopeptidase (penicillin-binding protein 7)